MSYNLRYIDNSKLSIFIKRKKKKRTQNDTYIYIFFFTRVKYFKNYVMPSDRFIDCSMIFKKLMCVAMN